LDVRFSRSVAEPSYFLPKTGLSIPLRINLIPKYLDGQSLYKDLPVLTAVYWKMAPSEAASSTLLTEVLTVAYIVRFA